MLPKVVKNKILEGSFFGCTVERLRPGKQVLGAPRKAVGVKHGNIVADAYLKCNSFFTKN